MKKTVSFLLILFCVPVIAISIFSRRPSIANKTNHNLIYLHEQKKASRSAQAHLKFFSSIGNVILVFYADWCGPCTRMKPLIEIAASESVDTTFIRINIDYFEGLKDDFDIQSIPTLVFLRNDAEIGRYDGKPLSQKQLTKLIKSIYASAA